MGYTIEISFDITKHSNVSLLKEQITGLALDFDCDNYYYFYEMDGAIRIPRNHCIIAVQFIEENLFQCADFIKTIKKIHDVHIECIYEDDILCKLIYASRYYLQHVDKRAVVIYNKFKRERSYSDNETIILEIVEKKKPITVVSLDAI
jgi:hypothetical protein